MSAELYNAALESWRGTYAWWKERHPGEDDKFPSELRRSKYDLMKEFTGVRSDIPEWERLAVQVGRGVVCRFDRTVSSFYKRCKEGGKPGFPRFVSETKAVGWPMPSVGAPGWWNYAW